jgi:cation:H+ antiporter
VVTHFVYLIVLFGILSLSSDFFIRKIRLIASRVKLPLYFLGLMLGFFTTLPEFFIGINALTDDLAPLIIGNLFGGIVVLIGLLLGCNLIMSSQQSDLVANRNVLIENALIVFALLLGLRGKFGFLEGCFLTILCLAALRKLYHHHPGQEAYIITAKDGPVLFKNAFGAVAAMAVIIISSHLTVSLSEQLLTSFQLTPLMVGVLLFAFGTNLPELVLMISSWLRNTVELSIGHIMSSAFSNIVALGLLAIISPINFPIDKHYYVLLVTILTLLFIVSLHSFGIIKKSRVAGALLIFVFIGYVATFLL